MVMVSWEYIYKEVSNCTLFAFEVITFQLYSNKAIFKKKTDISKKTRELKKAFKDSRSRNRIKN